jgi:hypothetical protein
VPRRLEEALIVDAAALRGSGFLQGDEECRARTPAFPWCRASVAKSCGITSWRTRVLSRPRDSHLELILQPTLLWLRRLNWLRLGSRAPTANCTESAAVGEESHVTRGNRTGIHWLAVLILRLAMLLSVAF